MHLSAFGSIFFFGFIFQEVVWGLVPSLSFSRAAVFGWRKQHHLAKEARKVERVVESKHLGNFLYADAVVVEQVAGSLYF